MTRFSNKLKISASILLSATFLGVGAAMQTVQAQSRGDNTWGKGIDLGWYCPRKIASSRAVLQANDNQAFNVVGWKCQVVFNGYIQRNYGIDVADACRSIYGTSSHGYGRYDDPNSWFCGLPRPGSNPQYYRP